jgi:type I restriction enzyme S subunit
MTDWPVKTLGEVCDFVSGSVTPKPGVEYEVFSVPSFDCGNPELLDGSEIKSSKRPVEPGDVLLCKINPRINRVWRVDRQSKNQQIASTEWIALRCRGNILDVFLQYVLQAPSVRTAMIESVTGATGSHTRAKYEIVEDLEFSVPPLEEQKRIVALLDTATARITELTKCYEQARTHSNNLFTSALRDALTPLESWPVKRLGDLCLFVRGPFGGSLKKSVFVATGHAVYEQQHAIYERFNQFRYFISEDKFQEMKRFEVTPGDILMSCSGTIGKTAIVPSGAPAGIINQALLKLTCLEQLENQYLCVWMRSSYFQEAVIGSAGGAALQNVASVSILKDIPISLPPLDEQKRIVTRLDAMKAKTSEMIAAYDAKLTAAKNLRQSILEAAFAGEL